MKWDSLCLCMPCMCPSYVSSSYFVATREVAHPKGASTHPLSMNHHERRQRLMSVLPLLGRSVCYWTNIPSLVLFNDALLEPRDSCLTENTLLPRMLTKVSLRIRQQIQRWIKTALVFTQPSEHVLW